jgi:hypothetical protein
LLIARYLETEIKPKVVEPNRSELWSAFQANQDKWRRPPRRMMSLIEIRILDRLPKEVDQPTREQLAQARAEAKARAKAAHDAVAHGAEFTEVVREYSEGLSAAEGGSWGWVTKEGVRKRFEPAVEALYRLQAGEVSGIIEADDAFFIVRCDALDPGVEPDFQSVQPELREWLYRAAYNQQIAERVRSLRDKARIEPADLNQFHAAVVQAALDHRLAAAVPPARP